jgi:hypothetical protein
MNARRGGALLTIIAMMFFAILCTAVIGVAQMNVHYYSFFEHRGLLKQATLTFAESLAENVQENAATLFPDRSKRGSGVYTGGGDLPMRFTYVISPDNSAYTLFVKGEYKTSPANDIAWEVSVDVFMYSSNDVTAVVPVAK